MSDDGKDTRFQEMRADAKRQYQAQVKLAHVLETLPNDETRRRVLLAAAILLGVDLTKAEQ